MCGDEPARGKRVLVDGGHALQDREGGFLFPLDLKGRIKSMRL